MKKFRFRLQRLLEYRAMAERWAKDAFLQTRADRLAAEAERSRLTAKQAELLRRDWRTLDQRKALEAAIAKLDDLRAQQSAAIAILAQDEEARREDWMAARRELEAMRKLRELALERWETEAGRKEQAELDEWALLRSAA